MMMKMMLMMMLMLCLSIALFRHLVWTSNRISYDLMVICGELNTLATDDSVDDEDDDTDNVFFMTLALTTAMPHKWESGVGMMTMLAKGINDDDDDDDDDDNDYVAEEEDDGGDDGSDDDYDDVVMAMMMMVMAMAL